MMKSHTDAEMIVVIKTTPQMEHITEMIVVENAPKIEEAIMGWTLGFVDFNQFKDATVHAFLELEPIFK